MTQHYDAIIIGTGQSGPALATRLAGAGMKVAILERKQFARLILMRLPHNPGSCTYY